MVTFNVDSLDFSDDETARFGAGPDFDLGFDSANSRLELDDLVNAQTAYIQQNRAGDLVDGRFAETVAEGKALADDGNLYDSIDTAISNASSWVKVGPGHFYEKITVGTAGITIVGSGNQTVIHATSTSPGLAVNSNNVTLSSFSLTTSSSGNVHGLSFADSVVAGLVRDVRVFDVDGRGIVIGNANDILLDNCLVENTQNAGILIFSSGTRDIIYNCTVIGVGAPGTSVNAISPSGDDGVVSNCHVEDATGYGISTDEDDGIIYANRIHNSGDNGINLNSAADNNIVVNNRVSNSGNADVSDSGTGNTVQDNLTGSAN